VPRSSATLAALIALAGSPPARARPTRGIVTHAGAPVAGATVSTAHGDIGITADDGTFVVDVPDDAPALTIDAPGFAPRTLDVTEREMVEVALEPDGATGSSDEYIEVTGVAPPPREPMAYRLTGADVRDLPGAAGDALRAIQVLPGTARIPFGLGGLALRGTSPRDTAVYLDGIEVPLAFHFGGVTSFYPSTMLELDVVASVSLGAWQAGARLTATSGIPYDATDTGGVVSRQLPPFVELDVRIARRWHRGWGDVVAYIDLHNATNRANVEGRYQDPDTRRERDRVGLPILPFVGVELMPPP
jgi:hypothetical protein